MKKLALPDNDFSGIARMPLAYGRLGMADAHDVVRAHVAKQLKPGTDEYLSVLVHEETHLKLFRTTSFGHTQQFISQFSRATNSAGIPQVIQSPLEKIEAVMYETSWMVQEGAAVLSQITLVNGFDNRLLDPRFFGSLDVRYANSAAIFATAVGALTPIALAGLSYAVVMAIAKYCMNTDCIKFFEGFFQEIEGMDQAKTAKFYGYFSRNGANPQSRLFSLIDILYQDNDNTSVNEINKRIVEYCVENGLAVNTGIGLALKVETESDYKSVIGELERIVTEEIRNIVPAEEFHFSNLSEVEEATRRFYQTLSSVLPDLEMVLKVQTL